MIPNIFVSSTIADLRYLRDGIRDAIEDLAYRPVMSEHGEIGYVKPVSAAESCYRSVRQCQMVILIVGKRYGSVDDEGMSVTHREYLAARNEHLPIITFVEPEVLSFKEVYDSSPDANLWETFSRMDNAHKTFKLLADIAASESYSAILPFNSVGDAKRKLKLQIADFVGDCLADVTSPVNQQVRDILAEVRTMRNFVVHSTPGTEAKTKRFLAVTRYLLNERCKEYRDVLGKLFADLDIATGQIDACENFECVVEAAGWTLEVVNAAKFREGRPATMQLIANEPQCILSATYVGIGGSHGGYEMFSNKLLRIAQSTYDLFDDIQRTLKAKADLT